MSINQKGFTLIEGLLIVIALSLVTGVGYYVYNTNKNNDKLQNNSQISSDTKQSKSSDKDKRYLEVQELGIKFEVTDELKNIYYKVDENGYVYLSVHELDNIKGFEGCTAGSGAGQDGIAAFSYAKVGDDHFGTPWTEADLKNRSQAKVGDTYYWVEPRSQAPCFDLDTVSEDNPNVEIMGKFKKAIVDQGPTITAL
jgi:hypothetical protein